MRILQFLTKNVAATSAFHIYNEKGVDMQWSYNSSCFIHINQRAKGSNKSLAQPTMHTRVALTKETFFSYEIICCVIFNCNLIFSLYFTTRWCIYMNYQNRLLPTNKYSHDVSFSIVSPQLIQPQLTSGHWWIIF